MPNVPCSYNAVPRRREVSLSRASSSASSLSMDASVSESLPYSRQKDSIPALSRLAPSRSISLSRMASQNLRPMGMSRDLYA